MAVPYTFGSATTSIPLSQLDSNFATTITLGNTAIQLGNTVTTLNNMTLGNVTVSSGNVVAGIASSTITQSMLATGVAGTGPAFSAYSNANQSITAATATKVSLQLEVFDTANAFDSTTNYRFTPQVAGYYQVNAAIYFAGTAIQFGTARIYKNGSLYQVGQFFYVATGTSDTMANISSIVYLNGSTDYIELYGNQSGGTSTIMVASSSQTYFNACLIRSA
jgi:hypothetical protein